MEHVRYVKAIFGSPILGLGSFRILIFGLTRCLRIPKAFSQGLYFNGCLSALKGFLAFLCISLYVQGVLLYYLFKGFG